MYKQRTYIAIILCISLSFLVGCASTTSHTQANDPYEGLNRVTYTFNDKLDKMILKPVAIGYDTVLPAFVKKRVSNFFVNFGEVPTMANDLLQGHLAYALNDFWRLFFNSTIGIAGLFDVATSLQLENRYNDLGITFAKWGWKDSAYIVIPFIGPSTIRDGFGLLIGLRYLTVWPYIESTALRNSLFALAIVSLRASLLDAEGVMQQAALDPYVFLRNAYLQKRMSLINSTYEFPQHSEGLDTDPMDYEDLDYALDDGGGAETGDSAAP